MDPDDIIAHLKLEPHPEGGWFRQTFIDTEGQDARAHSTAIYYLLKGEEQSAWHRVDAVEIWHFYAGAPLALRLSEDGREEQRVVLGPDVLLGQQPQVIVPRHCWQTAQSSGDWTLVGCTVAPGFRFSGFELAPAGWAPR
jgi:uncharacterized protein